ncbi:hypothetical protein M569_07219, partial [Genlisea aurea]
MGAQSSIQAGNAKIDFNVDFTQKLCAALMLHPFRNVVDQGSPFSLVIGSLCIKHQNLFGKSEKLDFSWDKGVCDSNILISYRSRHAFFIQHSVSPDFAIHGIPVDNFSRSASGGVNLSRFSAGLELQEPATSGWSNKSCIKFEHIRPLSDDGRALSRDLQGFFITASGGFHDSMVTMKQVYQFAKTNDRGFTRINLQVEQGVPIVSKWLIFNRFKFIASRGIKVGPAFFWT